MQVEFTVGTSLVSISGSAGSIANIRRSVENVDHLIPMFTELDEVKKILPVAGAGNAVLTIRTMVKEIQKLRHAVQGLTVIEPEKR